MIFFGSSQRKKKENKQALQRAEKEIQALKELDSAKDDFLNVAAHELKTPLTSILGMAELLEENISRSDLSSYKKVSIIHKEAKRLQRVVQQILTVTRFESGKIRMHEEMFDLGMFLKLQLPSLRMIAKRTDSRIVLKCEKERLMIQSDKQKIVEILSNLVDNAVKYGMPKQMITIVVGQLGDEKVEIEVIDRGKGIESDLQEKLFVKFGQLEASLSRSQEGMGLGLYICKLIAKELNGDIGVRSVLGEGSTFSLVLPLYIPVQDD